MDTQVSSSKDHLADVWPCLYMRFFLGFCGLAIPMRQNFQLGSIPIFFTKQLLKTRIHRAFAFALPIDTNDG